MAAEKKIIRQEVKSVTDLKTGEVVQEVRNNVFHIPAEPPYVKMYLDDICGLINVPDSHKALLLTLLRRLDYEGFITLSPRSRKEIAKGLGIADQTFRNRLNELCKCGLIRRESTNEYLVNPKYFARGEWKKICTQREAFKLTITYSEKGGRSIETEKVAEQTELPL